MTYGVARVDLTNDPSCHSRRGGSRVRRRTAKARLFVVAATIGVMLASIVGAAVPASATDPLRVLLTGVPPRSAAPTRPRSMAPGLSLRAPLPVVPRRQGRHDRQLPAYRGRHQPAVQADRRRPREHGQGLVEAYDGYTRVAEKASGASNWIMYNMAPPVLSGVPHVGQTIKATLGPWYTEWWTTLTWRNTSVPIPGQNGLTYTARPADAGKEISLLAIGEYEFPNGVHPIDRYAAWMRIRWATKSIMRGTSPSRGVLRLTVIAYAAGAVQSNVHGHVSLYDGTRRVSQFWVPKGRKVVQIKGLRRGRHNIRMVFDKNSWFDASRSTRAFAVR